MSGKKLPLKFSLLRFGYLVLFSIVTCNKVIPKEKGSSIAALKLTPKHTSNTERIAQ